MDEQFEKFFNYSIRFLSYRPRSEYEVRQALIKKKFGKTKPGTEKADSSLELFEKIITKLKEQNFLNDTEFTRWWIEQRTKVRPKGLQLIKRELRQKGISQDLIEEVLTNKSDELPVGSEDQLSIAKQLVQKRLPRLKGLDHQEQYQKLGQFLGRRGFDFDTIRQAIDGVIKKGV